HSLPTRRSSDLVDMAPNFGDWKPTEDAEVDAALIVPIDDHEVRIYEIELSTQHLLVESLKSGPILYLNAYEDVGSNFTDNTPRVEGSHPIHILAQQFEPSDPVVAPVGNDL